MISDRDGPSWRGELGRERRSTVDWYDQTTGTTVSERVAVLRVKRVPAAADAGPYDWRYGIKVRLTSLDERAARRPVAYQFLQLSDGRDSEDGVSGLGDAGGPDLSRAGQASVGWLYQWAEEGFTPDPGHAVGRSLASHLVAGLATGTVTARHTRPFPFPCRAIMRESLAAGLTARHGGAARAGRFVPTRAERA